MASFHCVPSLPVQSPSTDILNHLLRNQIPDRQGLFDREADLGAADVV